MTTPSPISGKEEMSCPKARTAAPGPGAEASGGLRPNPGADETVNVPYDIGGRRLE
jgi:hypothetical protein